MHDWHGHAVGGKRTKMHGIWHNMRQRCRNPKATGYKNYGGRGITVCERWDCFSNFLEDMGEQPEGMFLDRIDTEGHYTPENCKWSTRQENNRNRRNAVLLTVDGRTQNVNDWAREVGIDRRTISSRLRRGWNHKDSIYGKSLT